MGHDWKAIVSNCFPGRTALQARNQYNQVCRRTGCEKQPSTPGSVHSATIPLATNRSFSSVSHSSTNSKRQQSQEPRTYTHLESGSNDDLSSEEGNEDDDDDPEWSQSDKWSQWDLRNETNCVRSQHSPPYHLNMPSVDIEHMGSPLPTNGTLPFSSFDQFFPEQSVFQVGADQALEASDVANPGIQVETAPIDCGNQ